MHKLVLVRHGESLWIKENHFHGTSVGRTKMGVTRRSAPALMRMATPRWRISSSQRHSLNPRSAALTCSDPLREILSELT
jgi:broad specificity phosphatase PhoE